MGCTLGNHIPFLTPLIRSKLYTMDNGKFSISIDAKDLSSLLLFHNIHYGDVCFVALRPRSTAMVIAGRSVHLTSLFSWATLNKQLTSTSCTYFRL